MSDTPETDAAVRESNGQWSNVLKETCQRLERERDEAREALEFRRGLYKVQEEHLETARRERDEAREHLSQITHNIIATLEQNRHLTDGDDCTLFKLKSVVPEWK